MNSKYCPTCNYKLEHITYLSAAHNYPCPRCQISKLDHFYSINSMVHKQILAGERYQSKMIQVPPPLSKEVEQ